VEAEAFIAQDLAPLIGLELDADKVAEPVFVMSFTFLSQVEFLM